MIKKNPIEQVFRDYTYFKGVGEITGMNFSQYYALVKTEHIKDLNTTIEQINKYGKEARDWLKEHNLI